MLNLGLILYGIRQDGSRIPQLSILYDSVVEITTAQRRQDTFNIIEREILQGRTSVVALLPLAIRDPDKGVASSAALSLVSNSPLTEDGVPYGLIELDYLLRNRVPKNMGAVFGGVACLGDKRMRPLLEGTKEYLTPEEVETASRCITGIANIETLDFWLSWAEQLVCDTADVSQGRLGASAAAFMNQITWNRAGNIQEIRRHFKTGEPRVEVLKLWTLQEYAFEIAPRLYRLEQIETCPRIFPAVLQRFGLEPRSPSSEWAETPDHGVPTASI